MICALWGANGAGKTTISSYLAKALAKKHTTLLISGNLTHSTIQHVFGISEKKKSIINVLSKISDLKDNIIQFPDLKDLFILDISSNSVCTLKTNVTEDQTDVLLETVEVMFDVVLVDCSVDYDNVLTRSALRKSKKVMYALQPTLESVSFTHSHYLLLDKLKLLEKTVFILNNDSRYVVYSDIEKELSIKFSSILPRSEEVHKSISTGRLINKASKRVGNTYLTKIDKLANMVISEEGNKQKQNIVKYLTQRIFKNEKINSRSNI